MSLPHPRPPTLAEALADEAEAIRLAKCIDASGWDEEIKDAILAAVEDSAIGEDSYLPCWEAIYRYFFRTRRYSIGRFSYGLNEVDHAVSVRIRLPAPDGVHNWRLVYQEEKDPEGLAHESARRRSWEQVLGRCRDEDAHRKNTHHTALARKMENYKDIIIISAFGFNFKAYLLRVSVPSVIPMRPDGTECEYTVPEMERSVRPDHGTDYHYHPTTYHAVPEDGWQYNVLEERGSKAFRALMQLVFTQLDACGVDDLDIDHTKAFRQFTDDEMKRYLPSFESTALPATPSAKHYAHAAANPPTPPSVYFKDRQGSKAYNGNRTASDVQRRSSSRIAQRPSGTTANPQSLAHPIDDLEEEDEEDKEEEEEESNSEESDSRYDYSPQGAYASPPLGQSASGPLHGSVHNSIHDSTTWHSSAPHGMPARGTGQLLRSPFHLAPRQSSSYEQSYGAGPSRPNVRVARGLYSAQTTDPDTLLDVGGLSIRDGAPAPRTPQSQATSGRRIIPPSPESDNIRLAADWWKFSPDSTPSPRQPSDKSG